MAKITIEDSLAKVENRFFLVHLASERARQLKKGAPVISTRNNKEIVLALREIASGDITYENYKNFEYTPIQIDDPEDDN